LTRGAAHDLSVSMPRGPKPVKVRLVPRVHRELQWAAGSAIMPHRKVLRARVILLAARGISTPFIARQVGCSERTVRKWRSRFAQCPATPSLEDRPRTGRPPRVELETRCELIQLACSRPCAESRAPFREVWSYGALRKALLDSTGVQLSVSEIGRILRAKGLRPHRMRIWLHSPDPQFRQKVRRICQLYRNPPAGATVLSIDEKTCIQALTRKHPTVNSQPGVDGRFEFEYKRHGIMALIAAFDVRRGTLFGQCRRRRTARDLDEFMEAIARRYPKGEVYVVWDNLNVHLGKAWERFNQRHGGRFHFVYTPKHASWMNQVELWFGILQQRLLRYGQFRSREELSARIEQFVQYWNAHEAHPFRWTFRGSFRHAPSLAA